MEGSPAVNRSSPLKTLFGSEPGKFIERGLSKLTKELCLLQRFQFLAFFHISSLSFLPFFFVMLFVVLFVVLSCPSCCRNVAQRMCR